MQIYVIDGSPIALRRPRFSSSTKTVYNSQKSQMLITSIGLSKQHDNKPFFEGPLHLDIKFFMPMPSKISHKNKSNLTHAPCPTKPDLSNLIKFLEDTCIGILYKDDAIITSITSQKVYSINPRTEFTIKSLSNQDKL